MTIMQMEDIFTDIENVRSVNKNFAAFTILYIYLQTKEEKNKIDYKNIVVSLKDKQAKFAVYKNKELLYPFYIILVGV